MLKEKDVQVYNDNRTQTVTYIIGVGYGPEPGVVVEGEDPTLESVRLAS